MALVADVDDLVALARHSPDLVVDLGDERTDGVDEHGRPGVGRHGTRGLTVWWWLALPLVWLAADLGYAAAIRFRCRRWS